MPRCVHVAFAHATRVLLLTSTVLMGACTVSARSAAASGTMAPLRPARGQQATALADEDGAFAAALHQDTSQYLVHGSANPHASAAYRWIDVIEEVAARRVSAIGAKPTIISRDMMISCTAMYDAWACYDGVAVGTRLGGTLRRPAAERTIPNQELAIGMAVTRCLEDLYPEQHAWIDARVVPMGVDPSDHRLDPSSPLGIGNRVADALLSFRHHDGANQLGDEVGSVGTPYSDYTYYHPQHAGMDPPDPDCWRPIPFSDGKGGIIRPGFLTPQWYRVIPVGMKRGDEFRPAAPPKADSEQMRRDVDEVIDCNSHLTLEQKALVEFMREGPHSTGQSGHWLLFAQDLSHRDGYGLEQDVKLFFCTANVAFDAFIACWDAKRYYDTSRPYWYVRCLRKGQLIQGYAGAGQGVRTIHAEEWIPYSPSIFVTPPFPGYTSGHATVSGAASTVLALFSGSDRFGVVAKRCAGDMTEPGVPIATMQSRDGVPATSVPATCQVDLALSTFSATANLAALSRLLGGYHIRTDNEVGLAMGRRLARACFTRYHEFFHGSAHGD